MRSLVLAGHRHGEDVDFLLLYVAFCGEVIWCSAELSRFIDVGGGLEFRVAIRNKVSFRRRVHFRCYSRSSHSRLLTDLVHSHGVQVSFIQFCCFHNLKLLFLG